LRSIINTNFRARKIGYFRGQIFCRVERSKGRKEGKKEVRDKENCGV
jgi:hypothetical protein